jgi:hypothetical protein
MAGEIDQRAYRYRNRAGADRNVGRGDADDVDKEGDCENRSAAADQSENASDYGA